MSDAFSNLRDDLDSAPIKREKTNLDALRVEHEAMQRAGGFACIRCNGSGRKFKGDCFSCRGTGRKAENAEAQGKRAAGARQAKATRARNLHEKREAFIDQYSSLCDELRRAAEWSGFARSLCDTIAQRGALSDKQLAAAKSMIAKIAANKRERAEKREAEAPAIDLSALKTLLETARANGKKKPALYFGSLRVTMAPETGRNAGALYLKRKGGDYQGKVADGKFYAATGADPKIAETLQRVAADPAGALRDIGRDTGVCCCCGAELTNPASIEAGIGPICAEKFGVA